MLIFPPRCSIEHSVNDQIGTDDQAAFENEVRFILQSESRPAVIGIEVMALNQGRTLVSAGGQQVLRPLPSLRTDPTDVQALPRSSSTSADYTT